MYMYINYYITMVYTEVLGAGSRVFFKSVVAGTSILKKVILFDLIFDLTFNKNEKV